MSASSNASAAEVAKSGKSSPRMVTCVNEVSAVACGRCTHLTEGTTKGDGLELGACGEAGHGRETPLQGEAKHKSSHGRERASKVYGEAGRRHEMLP